MPLLPCLLLASTLHHTCIQAPKFPLEVVHGNLRVQVLSPTLVRIEEKGKKGFEDRNTMTVVNRPKYIERVRADEIDFLDYRIELPDDNRAEDVRITKNGDVVFQWDGNPIKHSFLPGPSTHFQEYAIEDSPRIVPAPWGATPPPPGNTLFLATSGWDTTNNAPDIYVFLKGSSGYKGLRKEFLELTGHTEMPPLAAFGFWDSRYYEYKQQEALDLIDEFRAKDFPLDFFVVDTDWRVNGSHGYEVNTNDFPDMPGFIKAAHEKHVRLMYNDHPEPVTQNALAPEELEYRWKGLSKLLDWGADVWWYDRNWSTHLHEPMPGIAPEMWGDVLYHDMTVKARPEQRPMIMSNVQGIDNGQRHYAPAPAFHRYPIWWTGDTGAYFKYLKWGIGNGVDSGVLGLLPYVNEDLGGHWAHPTPELYVRYLEYGSLSPVTRIHCTKGEDRHPWDFGPEAEDIVRKYLKMRYRLLPTIYAAAHRAYLDGTPLLRRCDLEWPQYKEAADNQQFLLGDDILVAPVNESVMPEPALLPADLLHTEDGQQGLSGEYFANTDLSGTPVATQVDHSIDFDWKGEPPVAGMPKENWSARWTGKLGPVPDTGDYHLVVSVDDGCRLFIDGKAVINDWTGHAETPIGAMVHLDKGRTYDLRLEYLQLSNDSACHLEWSLPSQIKPIATRTLWIPPGAWENAWDGSLVNGPRKITLNCPLSFTPMFVRRGGIVLTVPAMEYTGERPWDTVTADVYPYPGTGYAAERFLYEDDGSSNGYEKGESRLTTVTGVYQGKWVGVNVSPARGSFKGAIPARAWTLRFHLRPHEELSSIRVDGKALAKSDYNVLAPSEGHVDMPFEGRASRPGGEAGEVVEINLRSAPVQEGHRVRLYLR